MSDWTCLICGKVIRGVSHEPHYCSHCGFSIFKKLEADSLSSRSESSSIRELATPGTFPPPPIPHSQGTLLKPSPPAHDRGKERRTAKRVRPREPLHVWVAFNKPLQVLDISTGGLLVEHERAFKFGSSYEGELRRSDQNIRLRFQVVRSLVTRPDRKSDSAIRYHTAFQFLDAVPPAFFTLIPELSESP